MGQMDEATEAERARAQQRNVELNDHQAYAAIQGTRPLALGDGLKSSSAISACSSTRSGLKRNGESFNPAAAGEAIK